MKEEVASRLRKARENAGFATVAEAARSLGVNYQTYAGHENGNSGFKSPAAQLYSRKFKVSLDWLLTGRGEMRGQGVVPAEVEVVGLPIEGSIQAGHWLETTFVDSDGEPEMLPAARDPRFPRARQYALRVIGDSMDLEYPDGSHVTCVDFADSGLGITEGMIVHVERRRDGGQMVEITLKQIARRGGQMYLVPRSSNPAYQPLRLDGKDGEVIVRGVVTGGWRRQAIPA